jgi:hypothetical protein
MRDKNTRFKSQHLLYRKTKQLFECEEVEENYVHPHLQFYSSKSFVQLDIWIPSYGLCLEYHGKQHFEDNKFYSTWSSIKLRDAERYRVCMEAGLYILFDIMRMTAFD